MNIHQRVRAQIAKREATEKRAADRAQDKRMRSLERSELRKELRKEQRTEALLDGSAQPRTADEWRMVDDFNIGLGG